MADPWSAAIVGGASLLGGIFGSKTSNKAAMASAAQQYQYNLALQEQAQEWQEYMSNTAHQREVKDLEAAGINPILTATGGNGASTGSVGSGSVGLPQTFGLTGSDLASTAASVSDVIHTLTQIPLEKYRSPLSFAGSLFEKFKGTKLGSDILKFSKSLFKGAANSVLNNTSTSKQNLYRLYAHKDYELTPEQLLRFIGSGDKVKNITKYGSPVSNSPQFDDVDAYIRKKYNVRNNQIRR